MDMTDEELSKALQRAFPQGYPILRCEGGTWGLRHAARVALNYPPSAVEVLGPRGAEALGRAIVRELSPIIAAAETMIELGRAAKAATESAPVKARGSGAPCNTESGQ